MAGPIPCLGHPTRTAAIAALREKGLPTAEIAARVGIPVKTVSALECSANRQLRKTPDARALAEHPGRDGVLILPRTLADDLRYAARRREMSVGRLAIELLEHIARDKLFDAILDDGASR
ncbi:MAG: hypothetical protein A4S12_06915 [Proteobacteria bacterium SG_bin5]|nr:hypothetical protein [Sphingomonas sp.]OQW42064.1 MAG: hypothetical protein A4S12_06915 [Proteobacteria bacterium SG_bin5]